MAQVLHLITDCYDVQPNQQDLATCSICQENLPSNYIILTCGHAFCYECLFQWFMQHDIRKSESASTKCPNCRQELARHVKYIFTTDKRFKKKSLNRLEEIKKEEAETLAQLQQQALESLPALQTIMTLIGTLHESGMFSDSTNNTHNIHTQRTNNRTNYT